MEPEKNFSGKLEETKKVKHLVILIGLMLGVLCFLGVLLYAAGGALMGQLANIREVSEANSDQRTESERPQEASPAQSQLEVEPARPDNTQPEKTPAAGPSKAEDHDEPLDRKAAKERVADYGNRSGNGDGNGGSEQVVLDAKEAGAPEAAAAMNSRRTGQATLKELSFQGSLGRDTLERVLRRHANEIRYCYQSELTRHPNLQGVVDVRLVISPGGQVTHAMVVESTLGNRQVEDCLAARSLRWRFPKSSGEGVPYLVTSWSLHWEP